ncbi:hypothetical protein C0Q70_14472 [Pomacea canaliculata]|uniref:Uncharacterized protein n=1 Tax=Pomacea canaliculata TaxID=400727 RepID=A0A2T7P037_POMCA|nr:hypothetical protein C0Q70_14472 [Pomacea canaliculata]
MSKEQDLQEGVTHLSKEQDPQETVKRLSTERNLQETVAHLSQTFQWEELSLLLKNTSPLIARRLVSAIVEPVHRHSPLTACLSVIASVTNDVTTMHDDPGGSATCSDICDTCQVLLSYGADVNHQDWRGRTAVHWAAMAGRVDLLIVLLSFAADVTLADSSGQVALHYAVSSGNQACVDLLLQHDTRWPHWRLPLSGATRQNGKKKRKKMKEALSPMTSGHGAGDDDASVVNVVAGHGLSPLILAVQQGHDTICRQLLEAGAEVTAQEAMTRRTPLHYALYLKRLDLFNLLLNYSPDLTAADHRGTSVVHRCCAVSDVQYLSQLLSACDRQRVLQVINMADSEGATPVTIACQNGHLTHLSALLAHGASVSDRDAHGRTALHHCVENPDTACAELLLKADPSLLAAPDDEGLTPLHLAVIAANVPLIRLLLKRGASLTCRDHQQHTVAHWATVCGHAGVLDVLLEYDVELSSPDAHQAYPVHYAAQVARPAHADDDELRHSVSEGSQEVHGNLRLLRKLLDHGVSPEVRDKDMRTPIIWAASAGNAEACGLLVAAGANPDAADKDGLCALHCAASRGHVVCVRQLVTTCGARVDPTDQNQCTPLFYAITLGHCDCVTTLLQLGARSAHTDNRGRNSAHCAAVKGSRDIIESLRVQGVDLWCPSLKGDYPVHEAAQAGHVEIVQYLLEASPAGTDTVDAANKEGRTCLHIAALTNNLRLAKVLLDRGADVNAVMKTKGKSYTSYDAAVAKGYKEAADYLLFRGGTSAAKLKEASSVTECHQEELVDAGQSHGAQQGAHAHAGEMQAPPVTVVVVTSSPAREIGKEILVVGGVQLETVTSEEVDERVHSRHCETPGPSGDMANGLTVTVDDNEVGDKNKSVTADFPQTETGETEIVPSTQTKDGSTSETASLPTTETRDGSTPETASLQATETRDGPTNEARDGPTTDKTNIINSDIRDTTPAASDALTFQTKDITAAESRDAQIAETRDEPSTDTEDMPAIEAVTGDMPFTGSLTLSVTERRDMSTTETRDMPVTKTRVVPTTEMPVTHNRDMPTVKTRDMPITETTDMTVTETREMPITHNRDMPVTHTRDMTVTETKDMPLTETRDMTVTHNRDMPVTETRDMTVIHNRDMPVTHTRDMTVTETRDMTVIHNRDMPVTHTRDMTVTETRDMPLTETSNMTVTQTRDMPVTQTRDMPVTQTTDMTVTETRDMTVTQTTDMTVTHNRDMPVTHTRDMTVTETKDMPLTETRDMTVTHNRDSYMRQRHDSYSQETCQLLTLET